MIRGGSEHSFGIHVAQMAGMPKQVTKRAADLLKELEKNRTQIKLSSTKGVGQSVHEAAQVMQKDPVLERIRMELEQTDVNHLSPLEALVKLNALKQLTCST